MQTISQFIQNLGGTVSVAKELGLTPSTVSSWRGSNRIPKWRIGAVMEIAVRKGVQFPEQAA